MLPTTFYQNLRWNKSLFKTFWNVKTLTFSMVKIVKVTSK